MAPATASGWCSPSSKSTASENCDDHEKAVSEISSPLRPNTKASSAHGPGLETSIVRQLGIFTVIARDEAGNQRTTGGEQIAVCNE